MFVPENRSEPAGAGRARRRAPLRAGPHRPRWGEIPPSSARNRRVRGKPPLGRFRLVPEALFSHGVQEGRRQRPGLSQLRARSASEVLNFLKFKVEFNFLKPSFHTCPLQKSPRRRKRAPKIPQKGRLWTLPLMQVGHSYEMT